MVKSSITKVDLSLTSKTSIFIILLLTNGIIYLTVNYKSSVLAIKLFISSLKPSPPSELNADQCRLSMKESDNWFCELDADWKRRKMIHHIQDKRNHISDVRPMFFQKNWEPTIHCAFERRLGNAGDGGKWICDLHRFGKNNTNILVYSLGSSGDFSFEHAIIQQYPNAEIHTFDINLYTCPIDLCTFHQVLVGDGKNGTSKSFQMFVNDLGHRKREIHILKVDIESNEYSFFEEMLQSSPSNKKFNFPYVRQILFEIHLTWGESKAMCRRTHKLFELFRSNNYAIFHKEANLYDAKNVFEYAMLRLNRAFFDSTS